MASTTANKLSSSCGPISARAAVEELQCGREQKAGKENADRQQQEEDAMSQSLLEMSQFDNFTQMLFRKLPHFPVYYYSLTTVYKQLLEMYPMADRKQLPYIQVMSILYQHLASFIANKQKPSSSQRRGCHLQVLVLSFYRLLTRAPLS